MKSIRFNADEVRSTLKGRKTVFRKPIKQLVCMDDRSDGKPAQELDFYVSPKTGILYYKDIDRQVTIDGKLVIAPYHTGDILYVRETWAVNRITPHDPEWVYKADFDCTAKPYKNWKWRPSIHMPKEAVRIFLRVTGVRVERLQDILKDPSGPQNQVVREGFRYACDFIATWWYTVKPQDRRCYGWDANPWVWVIEFEICEKPEGAE